MTVAKLIERLQKVENQKANIYFGENIKQNVANEEQENTILSEIIDIYGIGGNGYTDIIILNGR